MDSNKCSEDLGFNHSYVKSPCNPLIEDYTQIFHMIDEEDIPAVQYKMSLRGPRSMRNVDGLNLILIDFYVPALTPRLKSTENSLQFSENINLFANGKGKGEVSLRLTVSQSVSLDVEPHLGLMTRYLLLFDTYGLLFVGHPL
jgi:hypothetical protein